MAERVAPADGEQLHHFVCTSCWDPGPLERVLATKAQRLIGGTPAVLIVDNTALLKRGTHSVGVARQYAEAAGKTASSQALVSLTPFEERGARLPRAAALPAGGVDRRSGAVPRRRSARRSAYVSHEGRDRRGRD